MKQIKKFWGSLVIAALLLAGCGGSIAEINDASRETGGYVLEKEEVTLENKTARGNSGKNSGKKTNSNSSKNANLPKEGEYYYDVKNVVLYLTLYGELPYNYITKKEAKNKGWTGGSVEDYLKDAAIGGDYYGNFEGVLPKNQKYHECDIDTHGYKNRGSRRLIYSDNGKFYYSKDHYSSFVEIKVNKDYSVDMNGKRYE